MAEFVTRQVAFFFLMVEILTADKSNRDSETHDFQSAGVKKQPTATVS